MNHTLQLSDVSLCLVDLDRCLLSCLCPLVELVVELQSLLDQVLPLLVQDGDP